jgi:hypothetical protein
MGKKKLMKKLREVATALPVVMKNTQEYEWVKGEALIKQGQFEDQNGLPIHPEQMYKQTLPVRIATNHHRKLKKMTAQYGEIGVRAYAGAVVDVFNEQEGTSHEVPEVAKNFRL